MDIRYSLNGVLTIIFGVILLIFHNKIGDHATRLSEKINEVKYSENVRKTTRIAFLISGIFFTISGIYALFK